MSDLKIILLDPLPMSSSMVFQLNYAIAGLLRVSKQLFCYDPSCTILKFLELVDICRASMPPDPDRIFI